MHYQAEKFFACRTEHLLIIKHTFVMSASPGKGKYGKEEKGAALSKKAAGDLLGSFESILSVQTIMFTEKAKIVKRGISKEQLATLKEIFEFDYNTLSDLLAVTDRTLHLK